MDSQNENTISEITTPVEDVQANTVPVDSRNDGSINPVSISSSNNNLPDNHLAKFPPVNNDAVTVEPADLLPKRGRGRPKGSGKKPKMEQGTTEVTPENLAGGESGDNESIITEGSEGVEENAKETPLPPTTDYKALAGLTVAMGTSTLAMLLGPEWNPEDDNEREGLTQAVAAYMQATEMKDIPPGALLALVLMTYSAKRFQKPSTANKLKMFWFWVRSKFGRNKPVKPLTVNA